MIGLRMCDGIHTDEFRMRTGFEIEKLAGDVIKKHRESGLLEVADLRVRLTRSGRLLADSVIVDFL